eukprot:642267-Hanusia_phi.AAC.6
MAMGKRRKLRMLEREAEFKGRTRQPERVVVVEEEMTGLRRMRRELELAKWIEVEFHARRKREMIILEVYEMEL